MVLNVLEKFLPYEMFGFYMAAVQRRRNITAIRPQNKEERRVRYQKHEHRGSTTEPVTQQGPRTGLPGAETSGRLLSLSRSFSSKTGSVVYSPRRMIRRFRKHTLYIKLSAQCTAHSQPLQRVTYRYTETDEKTFNRHCKPLPFLSESTKGLQCCMGQRVHGGFEPTRR